MTSDENDCMPDDLPPPLTVRVSLPRSAPRLALDTEARRKLLDRVVYLLAVCPYLRVVITEEGRNPSGEEAIDQLPEDSLRDLVRDLEHVVLRESNG